MKSILFIALLLPLTLRAQFNFEPDSLPASENGLGTPNFDSLAFELRLWNHNSFMSIFTQLSFNKKAEWNYRSGFFNHNGELTIFPEKSEIDIPQVWRTIDSLGVRTLPDQNDSQISIEKNGKLHPVSKEVFERLIASHGGLTKVELFSEDGYRTYSWINPIQLSTH